MINLIKYRNYSNQFKQKKYKEKLCQSSSIESN